MLDGVDITKLDVLALRRRVGLLTQSGALFAGTVAENVAYGPHLANRGAFTKKSDSMICC